MSMACRNGECRQAVPRCEPHVQCLPQEKRNNPTRDGKCLRFTLQQIHPSAKRVSLSAPAGIRKENPNTLYSNACETGAYSRKGNPVWVKVGSCAAPDVFFKTSFEDMTPLNPHCPLPRPIASESVGHAREGTRLYLLEVQTDFGALCMSALLSNSLCHGICKRWGFALACSRLAPLLFTWCRCEEVLNSIGVFRFRRNVYAFTWHLKHRCSARRLAMTLYHSQCTRARHR